MDARVDLPVAEKVKISVRDLNFFYGSFHALKRINLDIPERKVTAFIGPSGCGKSTLLRTFNRMFELYPEQRAEGQILLDGENILEKRHDVSLIRAKIGMVFQFHCLFEHLTAIENICLAPVHVHRARAATAGDRARELLEQLGVGHRAGALPRELSGGEAQRVAIARALATDPPVLLLDEPTASLDPERRLELVSILRTLVDRGRTLLVVTHDEDFATGIATRIVQMAEGRVSNVSEDV